MPVQKSLETYWMPLVHKHIDINNVFWYISKERVLNIGERAYVD